MNFSKAFFGLTACLFAASLTGCVIRETSPPPPPDRVGSITVDVTIQGTNDPTICSILGVDRIDVTIVEAGSVISSAQAPCGEFGLTFTGLPEGFYDAEVVLLDTAGFEVSDIVIVQDADVVANTDFQITVDFPASTIH
jgi:hypothetical protein